MASQGHCLSAAQLHRYSYSGQQRRNAPTAGTEAAPGMQGVTGLLSGTRVAAACRTEDTAAAAVEEGLPRLEWGGSRTKGKRRRG